MEVGRKCVGALQKVSGLCFFEFVGFGYRALWLTVLWPSWVLLGFGVQIVGKKAQAGVRLGLPKSRNAFMRF